jgi:diguanylate cyclase (GGDEF)-like protein/PAS domain S-box-containing protein
MSAHVGEFFRPLPGKDEARVVGAITWAAGAIALLVATVVPAIIFWLAWQAQVQDTQITARLHAAFVTQALNRSKSDWQRDVAGLLDEALVESQLPERRQVIDAKGHIVTENSGPLVGPNVTAHVPLAVGNLAVGDVVLTRSLRPMMADALLVLLISMALGAAIFLTLKVPVRALKRALHALASEQERSRRELEQYANVLFERAIDGILIFDDRGVVQSCNPRAAQMLGTSPELLKFTSLDQWVVLPAPVLQQPVSIGQIETHAKRRSGKGLETFPCEITISALPPRASAEHFLGNLRDLTERRQAEQHQMRLANFDSLTGLPNRSLFRERLEQAMVHSEHSGRPLALMFLDLDRFKQVNDSLGHEAGDTLLRHVARSLSHCLRKEDHVWLPHQLVGHTVTIARLGGDEFTVLLEGIGGVEQAEAVARRILDALQTPLFIEGNEIVVTSSIGIALFPVGDCSLDELLRRADMAMYRAKEIGRNAFHVYSEAMHANAALRLHLEARLRHAIERNEFRLHFQPKCSLQDGHLTGVEALLRWYPQDTEEVIPPDQFISVLEETGLIVPVGSWVVEEAVRHLAAWRAAGLPALQVAVNLSARQLRQDLPGLVADTLSRFNVAPGQLELELTESMLMAGDAVAAIVGKVAEMGVHLAIDDFGTGYSSLAYLKRFFVNSLKIDRSFIKGIPGSAEDVAIASAIIALARNLNLRVVAEGVEAPAQAQFLRDRGCDEMQGYLLSRPLPADEFVAWWRAKGALRDDTETVQECGYAPLGAL